MTSGIIAPLPSNTDVVTPNCCSPVLSHLCYKRTHGQSVSLLYTCTRFYTVYCLTLRKGRIERCCTPPVRLSVRLPTIYSKSESRRNFKFGADIKLKLNKSNWSKVKVTMNGAHLYEKGSIYVTSMMFGQFYTNRRIDLISQVEMRHFCDISLSMRLRHITDISFIQLYLERLIFLGQVRPTPYKSKL